MTIKSISVEQAKPLSKSQLECVGRFNLRLLADELGMLANKEASRSFLCCSNAEQVDLVYAKMHDLDLTSPFDRSTTIDIRIKSAKDALASSLIALRHAHVRELTEEVRRRVEEELCGA